MRVCPRPTLLVTLFSLALAAAAAYADDGQGSAPTLGGPIYDIAHFDVIPATANGVDFQQTAYSALFKYRNATLSDRGLRSFRVVNWVLAPNHSQIIDVWSSREAFEEHLARPYVSAPYGIMRDATSLEFECGGRRPRKGKACHHSTHQLPTRTSSASHPTTRGPGDVGPGGDRNINASTCKTPSPRQ